jgi:histidinol-phosphate/aromatic aminotransferase/cobyric acid decarboxylase-like protein/choline kinase
MQGLILAAGLGQRLGRLTRDRAKAMVEVNGRALIHRALDALAQAGVPRTAIVVGHAADALRAAVGTRHDGMEIVYLDNPVYAETNNIYSLWLAREFLEQDETLLLESDVVFEPRLLQRVVAHPSPNVAVVAKFQHWMDGTVTLLDGDDHIVSVVPKSVFDWKEVDRYFKTVNIYKFSRQFSRGFCLPFLEAYIAAFGRSRFYEQVLTVITYLSKTELVACRVDGEKWYEIDDVQDLDIAETLFAEDGQALERYQRRHGGYWRFPDLKDFTYLVNPFFPPEPLLQELRASLGVIAGSYPSGREVLSIVASRVFACEPSEILVGNGASELIGALLRVLEGPIGVVVPTFDEYLRGGRDLRTLAAPPPDFRYGVGDLADFARGLGTLVLVNPDVPTGHFLGVADVVGLAQELQARGVRLVVDESFVDFADPVGGSLIASDDLQRLPGLVVVRSISKTYGVPGLRLGVAASGDGDLLARLVAELPIWNVNSMAELFLQVVGKYRAAYLEACRQLIEERTRLQCGLGRIPFLRPLPSRGNYLLCEVSREGGATGLARDLLAQGRFLVKDCTGKLGLEGGEYVRFAVRGPELNDALLSALGALRRR